ncbi:unnamed protein product [Symbiodinium sp. KB8]|nr:unnamed protein product [Symbiodinium sp. KB8]
MSWRALFHGITIPELLATCAVGVGGGYYIFYPAIQDFNRRQEAVLAERLRRAQEGRGLQDGGTSQVQRSS